MTVCICAFDPGKQGACAFYFPDNRHHVAVEDLPIIGKRLNGLALVERLDLYAPTFAVIEQVGCRPGQGVSGVLNSGINFGLLLGIVQTRGIPYDLVTPAKWKGVMGLTPDKGLSRRRATEAFPASAGMFKRTKDDGRAEACLLARYAADHLLGKAQVAA